MFKKAIDIQTSKQNMGNFAVLNTDTLFNAAIFSTMNDSRNLTPVICDGGIEQRFQENYYFKNDERPGYSGYVFQYTLSGCGIFKKNNKEYYMAKGKGFLVKIPEASSYYLPKNCDEPWIFLYLHFGGEMLKPFYTQIEALTGGIFELDISAKTIRMALQLQERLCSGIKLQPYESTEFAYIFFCTLLRELETLRNPHKISLALKGKEILEQEFHNLESIEILAERLGVSKEHFCRIFKKEIKSCVYLLLLLLLLLLLSRFSRVRLCATP